MAETRPPSEGESKLHDLPVEKYLRESVDIFPEALPQELAKMPGQLAYWTARYADAQRAFGLAERDLDEYRARKRQEFRIGGVPGLTGKATVDAINDALELDPGYIARRVASIDAEAAMLRAKGAAQAVDCKSRMLMSLGGLVREELRGDPIIRRAVEQARTTREGW